MRKKQKDHRKKGKVILLDEVNIILRIPEEAVALEVTASLLDGDGKIMRVKNSLSVSDIMNRRQAFLENVEDGDDYEGRFVITDEGMGYLEQLKEGGGTDG